MPRHGLLATSCTLAVVAAGALVAPALASAGDDADRAAPKPQTIAKGLLSPLSLAVSRDGTAYVSQNFAGMLMKIPPGGKPEVVYAARRRTPRSARSHEHLGSLRFATTKGRKAFLWAVGGNGKAVKMADLGAFEEKKNPDGAVSYGFEGLDAACEAQIPPEVPAGYTGIVESHPYATAMKGETDVRRRRGRQRHPVPSPRRARSRPWRCCPRSRWW